jgi:hypothetical protein
VELIRLWLRPWRTDPVDLTSPMALDDAEAALATALETPATAARADPITTPRVVVGWVRHRRIRAWATPPGIGYSWNSMLRARLESAPEGSRLIGRLGCSPTERVFSAVLMACAVALSVSGLVLLTRSEAHGHGTGGYLPLYLGPVAFMAFFVGLIGVQGSAGRKNAQFLLGWLARTLRTRDSENPEQDGHIHQSQSPYSGRPPLRSERDGLRPPC